MNSHDKQAAGLRIAAAGLLLVAVLVAVFVFHVQDQLGSFLTYTQEHRCAAPYGHHEMLVLFTAHTSCQESVCLCRVQGGLIYSLLYAVCTGT